MTTAVAYWPSELPDRPSTQSMERAPNLRVEFDTDIGPPKVRRSASAGMRTMEVLYELSNYQVGVLDTFYLTTLKSGSLPYMGIHPRTGAMVKMMMKEPTYRNVGGDLWNANFNLRVMVS